MRINKFLIVFTLAPFILAGCSTKVKRMDVEDVKDISGRWNDTDSRITAEEMISDCLSRGWYANARMRLMKSPVVIVGKVSNQSSEHISTDTFVENLQRALINSGKVEFVASAEEREEIRNERLDQDENADEPTRKAHGKETGADYMLKGVITSIEDKEGRKNVLYYQVNLKLHDIRTNAIVWNGEKKIKKYVKRPMIRL